MLSNKAIPVQYYIRKYKILKSGFYSYLNNISQSDKSLQIDESFFKYSKTEKDLTLPNEWRMQSDLSLAPWKRWFSSL